ncbi:MAG: FtsH protease activity modulator HflK [Planctomycetes bacterium]|nr:FtsH protease activity modulator HflK [Planctomycetota bacterium]
MAGSRPVQAIRRGGVRLVLAILIGLVVLIGIFSSYYTVEAEGRAVVKRFGRVVSIEEPGLHFKWPFGIDQATFIPTEIVQKEEFGFRTAAVRRGEPSRYDRSGRNRDEALMLTGDLNVINVEWVVQYRIVDANQWMHKVRDQRGTIRDVTESVMRQVVGNRVGGDVLTVGRVSIASEVKERMQDIFDAYELGIHVSAVELQDVTPPEQVAAAFNEVNEARQEKERLVNLAEKERNQVLPRARGEAAQLISEAQAYATERVNASKGQTARFTALVEEYRKAEDLTRQRLFLEMVDEVLPNVESLYVVDGATNAPIPLLDLGAAAGSRVRNAAAKREEER